VISLGRLVEVLEYPTIYEALGPASPVEDVRVVGQNGRADELYTPDAKVGRHPHRRTEIPGQRRFDQHQST
jgi:hypothetical protein